MNPAIYLMLLVSHPDDTIEDKPIALYAQLVPLAPQLAQEAAQERQRQPQTAPSQGARPKRLRPVLRAAFAIPTNGRGIGTTCEPRREPGPAG
jgi:hypothetical protein